MIIVFLCMIPYIVYYFESDEEETDQDDEIDKALEDADDNDTAVDRS